MGKRILIRLSIKMSGDMLMQVGRVVYINYGPCKGKIAVVVDIVDENRILVAGPTTGVNRQVMPSKRVALTRLRIPTVMRNQHEANLVKNITAYNMEQKWLETGHGKKLTAQIQRSKNTDFDRFRAMVLRRQVCKHVRAWVKKNKTK